jgi:hypothetical protein
MKNLILLVLLTIGMMGCSQKNTNLQSYKGWIIVKNQTDWKNQIELYKPKTDSVVYIIVNEYFYRQFKIGDTIKFK